ncbi:hypothetical protein [uncultured Bifidobacterium sp.]|uniref:hypothetical protein n=1 Tax=uncultured Bifidobacterium sp. TaxID=165187 RepID=UPI00265DDEF1|nr:hypothetical protein [uncultured Bifidobacterium sp.]
MPAGGDRRIGWMERRFTRPVTRQSDIHTPVECLGQTGLEDDDAAGVVGGVV